MKSPGPSADRVLDAVMRSVNIGQLQKELAELVPPAEPAKADRVPAHPAVVAPGGPGKAPPSPLHDKILLADMLDDGILAARPGDRAFPLRVLLGHVGDGLSTEPALAFITGLNFYFRSQMVEEDRVRVGFEVSRAFYRFCREGKLETDVRKQSAPLLADLLTSQLERLRFESIDHEAMFDSGRHERTPNARASNARLVSPASFLVVIVGNEKVRQKALVLT